MLVHSWLVRTLRPIMGRHPAVKKSLLQAQLKLQAAEHMAAAVFPILIRPAPRKLTVAITAQCNLRCIGCRYGRDFMPGHELSRDMVRDLLDDAKEAGVETVRLYGGEPLLHSQLPRMVEHATSLALSAYITTNGTLLDRKIDELYSAGLRNLTVGYYGSNDGSYDRYVQRRSGFSAMERGVAAVRSRYGSDVSMQLNFLIMRPSCNLHALEEAWKFAQRYDMTFHTDLIHYSLPYFSEGPDRMLQFRQEDSNAIKEVVGELIRLKTKHPEIIPESFMSLRSIPDWLLKGANMRVPCDAYKLIWVGADGTVQLCYVTFSLGNLHRERLRDILFRTEHTRAARDAFLLKCPNCHCERDDRIQKHHLSRQLYGP